MYSATAIPSYELASVIDAFFGHEVSSKIDVGKTLIVEPIDCTSMIPPTPEVRSAINYLNDLARRANCVVKVGVNGVDYIPMNETERCIFKGDADLIATTVVAKIKSME